MSCISWIFNFTNIVKTNWQKSVEALLDKFDLKHPLIQMSFILIATKDVSVERMAGSYNVFVFYAPTDKIFGYFFSSLRNSPL